MPHLNKYSILITFSHIHTHHPAVGSRDW